MSRPEYWLIDPTASVDQQTLAVDRKADEIRSAINYLEMRGQPVEILEVWHVVPWDKDITKPLPVWGQPRICWKMPTDEFMSIPNHRLGTYRSGGNDNADHQTA